MSVVDAVGVPALEVQDVEKSFADTQVLRGVDLSVASGTLLAVLGPSGCGKTTLLRAIAGFISVDRGRIRVEGREVVGDRAWVAPEHRRVGIVPQEGALFPHLSVGQNVAFGLPRSPMRNADVARWLEMVDLADAADARPRDLSGGQQQRVALARALAAEPALVLLDEPFASLDASLRVHVRAEVSKVLREASRAAVLVTHDQEEALSIADQVAVMLNGRIEHVGSPRDIYRRPRTLAVARFIGGAVVFEGAVRQKVVRGPLGAHPVANDVPDGEVFAVLRPEQLVVDPSGTSAVVRHLTYTGPDIVVELVTDSGLVVTCHVPSDTDVVLGARLGVSARGTVLAYPRTPD